MSSGLSKKQMLTIGYLDADPIVWDVLFGGSAGGGKTFLGCWWQINRRLQFAGTRGLIGRNKRSNLYLTTMKTFYHVWESIFSKQNHGITFELNQQTNTIKFSNGSEIILKDLAFYPSDPEYTDLGSLEITDAFIDEAGEIHKKAKTIISTRIRHNLVNGKKALLMTSNPSRNFLKEDYVSDSKGQKVALPETRMFIPSSLYDNPNEEFVRNYEKTLGELPEYDKQRLLYGNWEMTENDNPFFDVYKARRQEVLKDSVEFSEVHPLWISFDFNHSPCTAILGQKIEETGEILILASEQVEGGTEALCKHLNETYDWDDFEGGIKVCGDTSGLSRTSVGGNRNDFTIIQEYLPVLSSDVIMAGKRNRAYTYSRSLCNYVFSHCRVKIDSEFCVALVKDLDIAMVKNDKLYKDRERGHGQDAGDAFRYLVNAMFPFGVKDVNAFINY
jgi:phage terminase large subunit